MGETIILFDSMPYAYNGSGGLLLIIILALAVVGVICGVALGVKAFSDFKAENLVGKLNIIGVVICFTLGYVLTGGNFWLYIACSCGLLFVQLLLNFIGFLLWTRK